MALDFSVLERAPTIAQGFLAGQQAAQQQAEQNRLRDMQMLQMEAQRENVLAQRAQREQQLRERTAAEVERNALIAAGTDPEKLARLGPAGVKMATDLANLQKMRGDALTQRLTQSRQLLDTIDPNDPNAPQQYLAWHEANHRDPIIGPMLAERGVTADQARGRIEQAIQQGPQAFAQLLTQSKLGTEKFLQMNKPFAVGGALYDPATRTFTQPPQKAPTAASIAEYRFAQTPEGGGFKGSYQDFLASKKPSTTVNVGVSTEKKYGEAFGSKIADVDIGKYTAAEKAPQMAESANRIINLVQRGDILVGPIANIKLNIARALNVAGANNEELISNTERLIAATGQSTLDAIKGAGLGAGQGFTDKDLKFLQGVAGGTIELTAKTLTELAELQHRAATRAAESWNKRAREIPKEVVAGTGLSTAPITVPPLASVKMSGPPAAAVQYLRANPGTKAQFDAKYGAGAADRVLGGR